MSAHTDRFTFHFDFRCPFCVVARERIEHAGLGVAISYRSVRHERELPIPARAPNDNEQAMIERELESLAERAPDVALRAPELWPSTLPAARLLAAIERTAPERADAFVSAVSRALWREGRDISSPLVLGTILRAIGCGGLSATDEDDRTLEFWRASWADLEQRTPSLVSPHGAALVGLPTERRLVAFLRSGRLGDENDGVCATSLTAK